MGNSRKNRNLSDADRRPDDLAHAAARWAVLSRFVLRAPALPVALRVGSGGAEALPARFAAALALRLGEVDDPRAKAAYQARAAFRPTPQGLLAGVAMGRLGAVTRIALGSPRAQVEVTWGRLARLARQLLDDEAAREQVALRATPSLLRDPRRASWLGFGPRAPVERVDLDPLLATALAATTVWRPWPAVRAAVAAVAGSDDPLALDDWLLQLVDARLLLSDLEPPLIGPSPLAWLVARLERLDPAPECLAPLRQLWPHLAGAVPADGAGLPATLRRLRDELARLPGAAAAGAAAAGGEASRVSDLGATLLFDGEVVLAEAAVARAAQLAPLLFRFAAALAGGTNWERASSPALDAATAALIERYEPGAFDLAALELGACGVDLAGTPAPLASEVPSLGDPPPDLGWPALPPALLLLLAGQLDQPLLELSPAALAAALPEQTLPPTFELILMPCREPAGAAPGTDWLLGLHGAAGSTWGRAAALGEPLREAFAELSQLEARALPGHLAVDLAYAPNEALAEVAAHPPLRAATLALSSWCEPAIAAAELELVLGPALVAGLAAAPEALGLQHHGRAIAPLPTTRLCSTTVDEEGVHRLLVGFGLQRAVAPWAIALPQLAPLAARPRLPRLVVDGFVVAPASFAVPPAVIGACRGADAALARAAIDGWRTTVGVPPEVQVGLEDQLLPLRLAEPGAIATLARLAAGARAFEIWPPLDRLVDAAGHRVEAVVAVARTEGVTPASVPRVDPTPDPGWRTFALETVEARQDAVLLPAAAAAVAALREGAIDGWFVQRYRDGAGRALLRLRAHAVSRSRPDLARFERRLRRQLAAARASGDLVAIETSDYYREQARFGADGLAVVERLWQTESELVVALAGLDPALRPPSPLLAARTLDALARGLGLGLDERREIAGRARRQLAALLRPDPTGPDALAAHYRAAQAELSAALLAESARRRHDAASPSLLRYEQGVRRHARARAAPGWQALLPSLLHLHAVRLLGPGRDREAVACYFWERGLEALARRR